MMSAEMLQVYVSIAGMILALIGVPLLFVQLRDVQRSVRSGAHAGASRSDRVTMSSTQP